MGIFRVWRSRQVRHVVSICLAVALTPVALTSAANAQSAQAQQQTMAIFEAIQAAASIAGVPPLPAEAVPVVTGMVSCAAAGTPVGTCATNIAISTALTQLGGSGTLGDSSGLATAAAGCITGGGSAASCVAQLAASQLPAEAQPLVTCIGAGGNIGDCAEKAALTVAQQQLGANLPPQAQQMVTCVIGGQSVASCASTIAQTTADQALKASGAPATVVTAVDGMVSCVAKGGNAGDCAKNVAVASIPAGPAHDFATCLNQPNASAQGCAATLASQSIKDPTAAALVGCMGNTTGDKAQQCIATKASSALGTLAQQQAQQGLATAIQTATTAINNLQINAPIQDPPKFPTEPAVLANLMQVAKGIQDGNWLEVVAGVGPEAAEIAGKIILSVFLTPALSDLLSPVVDSMIQNDVNAFTNGLTDLSKGDAVGVAEDIFKWYETQFIQAPCALMPSGDVSNAICNGLAASINWVATEGGDIAKDILNVGEGILKDLGVWNFVDGTVTTVWNDFTSVIKDIGHFLGLGSSDPPNVVCIGFPTPASYFATNVLSACLNAAASNAASSSPTSVVGGVAAQCKGVYDQCATTPAAHTAVTNNCTSMGNALAQAGANTAAALLKAASGFAQTAIPAFVAKTNSQYLKASATDTTICDANFWNDPNPTGGSNLGNLADSCAKAVGALFQLPANTCPRTTVNPTYDALTQACMTAISQSPQFSTNASSGAAGPNSPLCKQVTKISPCSRPVTVAWGFIIYEPDPSLCDIFKGPIVWRPTGPIKPPPIFGGLLPGQQRGGPVILPFRPITIGFPIGLLPPVLPGGGLKAPAPKGGPVVLPPPRILPGATVPRLKPPIIAGTGNNGGHGDPFFVNGCSGNSPAPGCPGSSGKTSSSAMDNATAAATGGGLTGVAAGGGFGGPSVPGRPPIGGLNTPKQPPGILQAKNPPTGGGTGGTNGTVAQGGGTGGINGTVSQGGGKPLGGGVGNIPWRPTPVGIPGRRIDPNAPRVVILPKPPAKPSAPASDQIDYGGCASCTNPAPAEVIK
jgi:hypothetical protein